MKSRFLGALQVSGGVEPLQSGRNFIVMTQWLSDILIRRPIQALSFLASIGFILVVVQFSSISDKIAYNTALKSAEAYSDAMVSIRDFYSSEIVPVLGKGAPQQRMPITKATAPFRCRRHSRSS